MYYLDFFILIQYLFKNLNFIELFSLYGPSLTDFLHIFLIHIIYIIFRLNYIFINLQIKLLKN